MFDHRRFIKREENHRNVIALKGNIIRYLFSEYFVESPKGLRSRYISLKKV
jgi:hypothetical protein